MADALRADPPVTLTARQRARAEITREILEAARRQLASDGAANISLRAIARDLGMPSSAIHRYFATREDLVTRLIVEAYDRVGAAAEQSQQDIPPGDLMTRFSAACRAVRGWALAHPHEYSLVFGSPIPDYDAPDETVPAAARVPAVLGAILVDAASQRGGGRGTFPRLTDAGRAAIAPAIELFADQIPAEQVQAGLMIWMGIFGTISFELYGHQSGSVGPTEQDRDAYFESCISAWAVQADIAAVGR